ncbi:HNH endonuclease [Amnibacterium setariae]|uniref:HNH endonuclease n=2 Tax=Amnibacterium setariae TaxID=2306585 RepID=A0A3A1TXF4_9MICO|nr:HNH endonuclease [Amnibacterium setariae]
MRGAGRRVRRGGITVLALGGAGLFLGGAAFGAPAVVDASAIARDAAAAVSAPAARGSASPAVEPSKAVAPLAVAALDELPVKGRAPMTGYRRTAEFGKAWLDVDRNGCDTRDDVLRRDLEHPAPAGCRVRRGVLHDPYTGKVIRFVRGQGTSEAVQIDHVVPLADAWRTGAQRLTRAQRVALANDPVNLFAVDGPTNTRKSDGDAATWLPPRKAFRCTYVAHQVAVKRAYGLWVTRAERAAIARVLDRCPGQRLPAGAAGTSPGTTPAAAVHPGALCSPRGATGRTAAGTAMLCRSTAADARTRWRAA